MARKSPLKILLVIRRPKITLSWITMSMELLHKTVQFWSARKSSTLTTLNQITTARKTTRRLTPKIAMLKTMSITITLTNKTKWTIILAMITAIMTETTDTIISKAIRNRFQGSMTNSIRDISKIKKGTKQPATSDSTPTMISILTNDSAYYLSRIWWI